MHRPVVVGLLVFALVATGMGAAVTLVGNDAATEPPTRVEQIDDSDGIRPAASATAGQTDQEFDRTTFRIVVDDDGTATWTFEYKRSLATDGEVEEFETFAERFESEETDLYVRFTEQATALVASGEQHTDREMDVSNFERSAGVEGNINAMGVVEMSFTWTGFATVDEDDRVVVSDVFEGGFFLMSDQSMTIRAGDGLAFRTAQPEPEYGGRSLEHANAITWFGEMEFADGQPYVILVSEDRLAAGDDGAGPDDGLLDATTVASIGLVLAVLGLVAFAWHRYEPWRPGDRGRGTSSAAADVAPGDDEPPAEPIGEQELMSDEDRVVALIRQNGGRMKQVNIVEETGWSKSKVSMLLSDMADEGTISKLRVGRENIISLEGFEPEATKSPFEE